MDTQPVPEFLEYAQLQKAMINCQLRKILGINDTKNYFLLHWISLDEQKPDDGSYVLIKFIDTDGKTICSCPACYEGGQFRDLFSDDWSWVINPAVILGWSYYPYDDRI